jgi:hypothetical protein
MSETGEIVDRQQPDGGSVHPLVLQDPSRYSQGKNGVVYDHELKRFAANPAGGPSTGIKSQSQAAALASTRWQMVERAQLAARRGLADLSGTKSSLAAWASIVREQAELAKDTERGRHSTEAARFVGQATGFLADRRGNTDPEQAGATLHLSNSALSQVLDAIAQARQERTG